jgi:hypothetical protein
VTQRIYAAPAQTRGRVLVMLDGEIIAQGSLSSLACIGRALSTPNADIYLHLDDAQDFKAWQIADQTAKRRLN